MPFCYNCFVLRKSIFFLFQFEKFWLVPEIGGLYILLYNRTLSSAMAGRIRDKRCIKMRFCWVFTLLAKEMFIVVCTRTRPVRFLSACIQTGTGYFHYADFIR